MYITGRTETETYEGLKLTFFTGRMVNIGSPGSIATTLMEKYIGFWSAYLLDLCAVALCILVVQIARPKFGAFCGLRRKNWQL